MIEAREAETEVIEAREVIKGKLERQRSMQERGSRGKGGEVS